MNEERPLRSYGDWILKKCLGKGAFGIVFHWQNLRTGKDIATKHLKHNAKLSQDEIYIMRERWFLENDWMKNLQTPYIVGTVGISDNDFLSYLREYNSFDYDLPVIVMEYCNGGDLRKRLNKIEHLNGFTEFEVRNIFCAVIEAIRYLHYKCKIEHRDIKPENIVCQEVGRSVIYKLSDFGYARQIPDSTIAQSVVGTRNYVAPEIIEDGIYTETVDYFSSGVLLYEVICGTQPFIPHQNFYNRMENIRKKSSNCIGIVQNIDQPNEDKFEQIDYILPQNHSSNVFINYMEQWLRSALSKDFKKRGKNENNELIFYSGAESILATKIVSIFSLKTYKKFYYDINSFKNFNNFINKICDDNNIKPENIFFIHPTLHPKKYSQNPLDYYVEEWCDTSDSNNPPVMLFVDEFIKESGCGLKEDILDTFITKTIVKCMSINPNFDIAPKWLLDQFEKEIHYFLSYSQHLLECYTMGLQNFVLEIEHKVATYDINTLNDKMLKLIGSLNHFKVVFNILTQYKQISNSDAQFVEICNKECHEMVKNVYVLKGNYHKIAQICKEMATNKIYEEYAKKDIFQLSSYRKFLTEERSYDVRIERGSMAIEDCTLAFGNFLKSINNCRMRLNQQILDFVSLSQNVEFSMKKLDEIENRINNFTSQLLTTRIGVVDNLSGQMNSLNINESMSKSLLNSHNNSFNTFDIDAKLLIKEFQETFESLNHVMDIE